MPASSLSTLFRRLVDASQSLWVVIRRALVVSRALAETTTFRGRPALRADERGKSLCTACGECAASCPTHCIVVSANADVVLELDLQRCMYCGVCARVCPVQAICLDDEIAAVCVTRPSVQECQT